MSEVKKGKILSDETKQKISKSHKGKKQSEEHRKNNSIAQKGRIPWNKGKTYKRNNKER